MTALVVLQFLLEGWVVKFAGLVGTLLFIRKLDRHVLALVERIFLFLLDVYSFARGLTLLLARLEGVETDGGSR